MNISDTIQYLGLVIVPLVLGLAKFYFEVYKKR